MLEAVRLSAARRKHSAQHQHRKQMVNPAPAQADGGTSDEQYILLLIVDTNHSQARFGERNMGHVSG